MAHDDAGTSRWRLGNEFAAVELEVDHSANSPRLKITDLRTGHVGYLDPLELERLGAARHLDLAPLVAPPPDHAFDPDELDLLTHLHSGTDR